MLLKGKKAIVTGGARGIGKTIVEEFLSNGASVYFIDLNPSEEMADLEKLASENGAEVVFKAGNVAKEEEITNVVKEILEESGGIDILVNNAGITRDGLFFRMSAADWQSVIDINLSSAFYISKVVGHHMMKRKSGSIVNVSSIVGVHGNAGQVNYSASKAGLIGITKSMGLEVAGRGVRVNAIAPGFIETAMTGKLSEKVRDDIVSRIPMKRMGSPKEVSGVVLFLASDLSTYVSGQVLGIDGCMGT